MLQFMAHLVYIKSIPDFLGWPRKLEIDFICS